MRGVTEHALDRVKPNQLKEDARGGGKAACTSSFKVAEEGILVGRSEVWEPQAMLGPCERVERRKVAAVLVPNRFQVSGQCSIDEAKNSRLDRTRTDVIGRDKAREHGSERCALLLRQNGEPLHQP
jgi:hypothetical protein